MIRYNSDFINIKNFNAENRKPDFSNVLKILNKSVPSRPTLMEPFINDTSSLILSGYEDIDYDNVPEYYKMRFKGLANAGYDFTPFRGSNFGFVTAQAHVAGASTLSLNGGSLINDWDTYEKYKWNDPDNYDYSHLDTIGKYLPDGMKLLIIGPGGVLENVIAITGYDNLCYMLFDDEPLVSEIFNQVGKRLLRYYENSVNYDSVGVILSNDDWGYNSQTMISEKDLRKYVIPWHKKIAEAVHNAGKPVMLHSCGKLDAVMDDIIDEIGYDGKHSFEDKICPVEEAYEKWGSRIAILGGIDVDFLCRSTPEEIFDRSVAMLERTASGGSYGLGSGNSIPGYIPMDNYLAMLAAVRFFQ